MPVHVSSLTEINRRLLMPDVTRLFDHGVVHWWTTLSLENRQEISLMMTTPPHREIEIIGDLIEELGGNRKWANQLGGMLVTWGAGMVWDQKSLKYVRSNGVFEIPADDERPIL